MEKLYSVHKEAQIGENVEIGSFTTIYADVQIGEGTWIGPNVTIMDGARIGKNCKIFPGAVISAVPQDLKFSGEKTTVEIGDNTTIRECATINKGTLDRMTTKVGNNCLLMAYVHLAHDVWVGNNCILANSANIAGHVTIKDNAILEGVVAVQQFVTIGEHTFIAGASLVRKNVPPFIKVAREPLAFAGVNTIGLRRRGFTDSSIQTIEDIYRQLFVHNTNMTNALKIIEAEFPNSPEKSAIMDFIKLSDKGIVRGLQG